MGQHQLHNLARDGDTYLDGTAPEEPGLYYSGVIPSLFRSPDLPEEL